MGALFLCYLYIICAEPFNASLLVFEGEDIENISAHLGHASVETTSKVYAHMYAEVKTRMAKTVSGIT